MKILGRQETVTDATGVVTRFEYDPAGRAKKTIADYGAGNLNVTTQTVFDTLGRRKAEIDPEGQRTEYDYDHAGRLTQVKLPQVADPENGNALTHPECNYTYDVYGNQIKIEAPKHRETFFTYDHQNRQTSRTLPESQVETFEYDEYGRQTRHVSFEGVTTDFIYDQFGRMDKKHYFDFIPTFIPGAGDDEGSVRDTNEVVDYIFDALGRTTKVIQDYDGDLLTTADQRVTDNTYDAEGRLTQIDNSEGIINYDYNDLGQLERTYTGANLASAVTETTYAYDRLGRLETVTAVKQNSTTDGDVTTYRYDAVGNLAFVIVDNDATGDMVSQYTYDDLNRLELLEHYYDANNNQQFDGSDRRLATYDYELRTDGRRSGAIEQTYDDTGTLIQTNTIAWVYDDANRLIEEYFDGQGTDHDFIDVYSYDLAGNRTQKQHDADPGFTSITEPSDLLATTPDFANHANDETIDYEYDDNDRLLGVAGSPDS